MTVSDFTSVVNVLLPEPHAGLLNGILFGTKAAIPKDLMDALITTSTLHIIALSGTNITILTSLVSITLLRFVSRRIACLLTIVIIIGFILFVGPSPSVIRAGIMGSISLLAVIFGRLTWSLLSWILAVAIMLIAQPSWIANISFQLSALASLGIILFGGKMSLNLALRSQKNLDPSSVSLSPEHNRNAHEKVKPDKIFSLPAQQRFQGVFIFFWNLIEEDLRVTLAAQVFTVPVLLFQFHQISIVSPLSNVLIGWVIQPLTVLGLVTAVLGWVWLPLGQVAAWFTWVPIQYILTVIWLTSRLPFASLSF